MGINRPLRIGFISQWYDPEKGSAVTPGVQARALAAMGHHVEVLTGWPHYPIGTVDPSFPRRPYRREIHGDIVVHRVPEYPSHNRRALSRTATYMSFALTAAAAAPRLLAGVDVTLVHSTPATAAIPAIVLKAARRVPFVLHIADLWPETVLASGFAGRAERYMARVLHRFCDSTYRRASGVAVTSPGMVDSIQLRGISTDRLTFAPNWADEAVFQRCGADPLLAAELGLPTDGFVLMYAGNVGHIQGLSIILDAARRLRDREDINFAIVGSGVAREELMARARFEGLTNVHFVAAQPFSLMGQVLALGDAQLISLIDEPVFRLTLPSKLQAALAAGRPILGAVAGDAARVIRESGCGQVVPPGDGPALAAAVVDLAASPIMVTGMGRVARQVYERDFSEAVSARRLSDLLIGAVEQ